jgi:hypothetical protein
MNSSAKQGSELIYISGALTAKTSGETKRLAKEAMERGRQVKEKGHMPFIPHCSIFYCEQMPWMQYYDWVKLDLLLLPAFDAILLEDTKMNKKSVGTMAELGWTTSHNIKRYLTIEEIPSVN